MRSSALSLPVLSRPRTRLRAHSPLHAHALVEAAEPLADRLCERSPTVEEVAAALPRDAVAALDIAATGLLPLGVALAALGELADTAAVRVHRPLDAGDPTAANVLGHLASASAVPTGSDPVSIKVAVAGSAAHAVVASLGRPRPMEAIADRVPGNTPRPWGFTRLAAGPNVVYVVADADAPSDEAWYQLLRGAVGLIITVDSSAESWHVACRAVVDARVAGLPCVVAGAVAPEQARAELGAVVPVSVSEPGTSAGARAALRLLAQTIGEGGHR